MAALSGSGASTIKIVSAQACAKGAFCVIGNVVGVAADTVAAGGTAVLMVDRAISLPKRQNATPITVGQKVYGRHNDEKINQASANGYTTYVGDALTASPANSSDEVLVWIGRGGA